MDLTRLAAKQKRVLEMRQFIVTDVQDEKLRMKFTTTLSQYSKLLAACWENKSVSPEADEQLNSLDRELDNFHEEARLGGGIKSLDA